MMPRNHIAYIAVVVMHGHNVRSTAVPITGSTKLPHLKTAEQSNLAINFGDVHCQVFIKLDLRI